MNPPRESVLDRFLRYVAIDTQSAEGISAVPSTPKQLDLARLLVGELAEVGAEDIRLTEHGIVMARLAGNLLAGDSVPVIGLIAHLDTSPAVSGTDVKVVIHRDYRGGDIVLPGDPTQVIRESSTAALGGLRGADIITSDGTTLLGSDDKAGIAEIMTALDILGANPDVPHGALSIAFTPDEETAQGIQHFDIEAFGAEFAYTVDAGELGEINNETWSARTATVTFEGVSSHPGYAKGSMVNAIRALADFVTRFPVEARPETTEGRDGFLHPYDGSLDVERSTLTVALRSFDVAGLDAQEEILRGMAEATRKACPGVMIEVAVEDRYANISDVFARVPEVIDNALEATRRAGLTPLLRPIRGGTDGSILCLRGLPTPDLFTGGQNWHGKLEFNSTRGLDKSTEMLVHLVQVWAEARSAPDDQMIAAGVRIP